MNQESKLGPMDANQEISLEQMKEHLQHQLANLNYQIQQVEEKIENKRIITTDYLVEKATHAAHKILQPINAGINPQIEIQEYLKAIKELRDFNLFYAEKLPLEILIEGIEKNLLSIQNMKDGLIRVAEQIKNQ